MTLPRLLWIAVPGVFFAAAGVRADDAPLPAVRDEAGLFSPEAARQASTDLDGIKDIFKLSLIIETAAAPPDDVRNQLKDAKKDAEKEAILRAWAKRADAAGRESVHVLICEDVARGWFGKVYGSVMVTVPAGVRSSEFTDGDARAIHDQLRWLTSEKNKAKNDAILLTAVSRLRENLRHKAEPAFPWLGMGAVVAVVLGLWGVLALVRLRLRTAAPPEPQRIGLFHALLGGMFGSVAASWIYDSLFVAASRAAAPAEEAPPAPALQPAAAETAEPPAPVDAEPGPTTTAERLDLAVHDHPAEEAPAASGPARF
jgi:hypothetical protein